MYEYTVERFQRSSNNDTFVLFIPILIVFGLNGVLKGQIVGTAMSVLRILMFVVLMVWLILCLQFYFRSFHYVLIQGKEVNSYPGDSITFECIRNRKTRIYERVMKNEVLCILPYGQFCEAVMEEEQCKPYILTTLSRRTAKQLYYIQDGKIYSAVFHPDREQEKILREWADENRETGTAL